MKIHMKTGTFLKKGEKHISGIATIKKTQLPIRPQRRHYRLQ